MNRLKNSVMAFLCLILLFAGLGLTGCFDDPKKDWGTQASDTINDNEKHLKELKKKYPDIVKNEFNSEKFLNEWWDLPGTKGFANILSLKAGKTLNKSPKIFQLMFLDVWDMAVEKSHSLSEKEREIFNKLPKLAAIDYALSPSKREVIEMLTFHKDELIEKFKTKVPTRKEVEQYWDAGIIPSSQILKVYNIHDSSLMAAIAFKKQGIIGAGVFQVFQSLEYNRSALLTLGNRYVFHATFANHDIDFADGMYIICVGKTNGTFTYEDAWGATHKVIHVDVYAVKQFTR
ncbi:MAG: hypothetical protein LBV16_09220 [Elusimicrobiota bacterium]|jgi:hypothetical protein|nr:hypothetical protein [Elusimicrobiota bacterium]